MNILLLNHYAGSVEMGMEFRPYYFAREWVKMGYSVRIVAGDFSHLRLKNPRVARDFEEEMIDGIHYHWIRTGDYRGNGARRAVTMFRYVGKLWLKAKWISRNWRPDVVIASSTYPLDTYAAQRIRRFSGARVIHEVHDMWPITLTEVGGMKKTHPFVIFMQMAENAFCRHSDYVVSLLPHAKPYFIHHGMEPEKFRTVPNGIAQEEWEDALPLPAEHAKQIEALKNQGRFLLLYFGSFTKSYAIDLLIRAVQRIGSDQIAVVFVGNGIEREHLISLTETGQKEAFVFLPPVPKRAVPSLTRQADALYVGALKNDMFRFGICMNKLFDSMMAGRPILYAAEAPDNYIETFSCGISVKAESVEALAEGIVKMLNLSDTEREQMGQNGRKAAAEHFEYKTLAARFAALFEETEQ